MSNTYNIYVEGAREAGKTSLCHFLRTGDFLPEEHRESDVWEEFTKTINVDGKDCLLNVFDWPGPETYTPFNNRFFSKADGFLVVYSVVDRLHSFLPLSYLCDSIRTMKNDEDIPIVLCSAKNDLQNDLQVTTEDEEELAEFLNVERVVTSSRKDLNVKLAFITLVKKIDEYRENQKKKAGPYRCILLQ